MKLPGLDEEWRDVPGEAGYQVSSHGRVRSRWASPRSGLGQTWKVLRGSRHPLGYVQARLCGGGVRTWWVHRLIATVFIGPPPFEGAEVRHLDGNPSNNRVDNLAWGTHAENQADIRRHGTAHTGERCKRTKLKDYQAREMVQLWAWGMQQQDIAEQYGVSEMCVSRIVNGHKWQTVTGLSQVIAANNDAKDARLIV